MNEKENHWKTRKMLGTRKESNEKTIIKSGNAGKPMEKTRKMMEKQYYQDETKKFQNPSRKKFQKHFWTLFKNVPIWFFLAIFKYFLICIFIIVYFFNYLSFFDIFRYFFIIFSISFMNIY